MWLELDQLVEGLDEHSCGRLLTALNDAPEEWFAPLHAACRDGQCGVAAADLIAAAAEARPPEIE